VPARLPLHVVLLAGGSGTRFWPWSRADRPKQLLPLAGRAPLVVETWRRARRLAPPSRIWLVAPRSLADPLRDALPELQADRLLLEPSARNTGPAIVLACLAVERVHPGATVAVFPTDHVVRDGPRFARAVHTAAAAAARGALVCLGVRPDRPATGFGWLDCARRPGPDRAVPIRRFVEKPDLRRAQRYLRSGHHLWNAGIFLWPAARFLEEAETVAPALVRAVRAHAAGRRGAWARAPKISVDYAVMEGASRVEVVALDAGWDDVGTWDAAARLRADAVAPRPDVVRVDSQGSAVFGREGRVTALVGVPDVVVVESGDALLVVARESAEKVRQAVDMLRRRGRGGA